jgi:predicted transcriptional regulator
MNIPTQFTFDENDEKAAELLYKLGMPKNIAKTLIFISNVDECQSVDIEHWTRLRQPEVSVATQELQSLGWIAEREIRKQGKGRPIKVYKSNIDISMILKILEEKKVDEFEKSKSYIERLENLLIR